MNDDTQPISISDINPALGRYNRSFDPTAWRQVRLALFDLWTDRDNEYTLLTALMDYTDALAGLYPDAYHAKTILERALNPLRNEIGFGVLQLRINQFLAPFLALANER